MKSHLLLVGIGLLVALTTGVQGQVVPSGSATNPVQLAPGGPSVQGLASADEAAALDQFIQATPKARFHQQGGRITRVFGTPMGFGATPVDTAERFRLEHATMLGVQPAELMPTSPILVGGNTLPLMYDSQTGEHKFTLVYYRQYRDGIPVFESDVRMLVGNGADHPLVWVGSRLRRLGDFRPDQVVAAAPRASAAMDASGMTNFTSPETVIWTGVEDDAVEPVLAVTFIGDNYDLPTADKPERWRFVADAATGEILYRENLIVFTDVTGTVSGKATQGFAADICSPEVATPMRYARVSIGSTTVFADGNGNFAIPNEGDSAVTVESPMSGQYFYVEDVAGPLDDLSQSVTPPGPVNFVHNQANASEWVRAQINTYVSANVVRDYLLTYCPAYPTISGQTDFPIRVNRTDGYCPGNAWYDGHAINFCQASTLGLPNTGYSSVVHHEYGHHVVECGGSGQDQYGEGMSDCVAVLISDDHILAWGFEGDCAIGLRDADNGFQYPCSGESHYCGNLLSGCVWSTRNELAATNPTMYRDILSALTINSVPMHSGHLITPQITIDFLTLDDNDGDLDNGTPHAKEICTGFGAHSMECPAGVLNPIDFQYPSGRPTAVEAEQQMLFQIDVVAAGANPVPETAQMHYSIDGGAWTTVAMNQTAPNQYQAIWPAQACRSQVDWYVSAEADDSSISNDPIAAPSTTYTATVGKVASVIRSDNFENSSGWTVGDVGDAATTGIWECAAPQGTIAQPGEDYTPFPWTKCWVTGALAGDTPGTNSVHGGKTTLMSPTMNLSAAVQSTMCYWRWYSNDQGSSPSSNVFMVDISNDSGGTWTNVETVGPSGPGTSGGWVRHAFQVADFVSPTTQVKVRFVASESGGDSLVEAAIDDFKVVTFQCDMLAPTPNPPDWVQAPTPISTTAITMQTIANDPSGVEYYFLASGVGSHSRSWGANPSYTDTALSVNRNYSYKVKARDGAAPTPNETAYSAVSYAATFIETPTALSFGAITDDFVQVSAPGTFTRLTVNLSGLFFEVTRLDGRPVGGAQANTWVQTQTITATGLAPGEAYRFRVKARNYYGLNETPWFPASGYLQQATTGTPPCQPCGDMDHDGDVDYDDYVQFHAAMGRSTGQPGYDNCADSDDDGVVTMADYQAWIECYRQFVGDQFAPPPAPGRKGDINGDGILNGLDVDGFVRAKLGMTPLPGEIQARANYGGTLEEDLTAFVADLLEP